MANYTYVSAGVFQKRLMCGPMTRLGEVTVNLDRTFQQIGILDEFRERQYVCIYLKEGFIAAAIVSGHQTLASLVSKYGFT